MRAYRCRAGSNGTSQALGPIHSHGKISMWMWTPLFSLFGKFLHARRREVITSRLLRRDPPNQGAIPSLGHGAANGKVGGERKTSYGTYTSIWTYPPYCPFRPLQPPQGLFGALTVRPLAVAAGSTTLPSLSSSEGSWLESLWLDAALGPLFPAFADSLRCLVADFGPCFGFLATNKGKSEIHARKKEVSTHEAGTTSCRCLGHL